MRVRIGYSPVEKERPKSLFQDFESKVNLRESVRFKIKLNKMPAVCYDFRDEQSFYIENAQLFKDKKNTLRFRYVSPTEDEERKDAMVSNIFRGIAFVFMAILLPFAVMKFKSGGEPPFLKQKFDYSETDDFALLFKGTAFAARYEPAGFADAQFAQEPAVETPAGVPAEDVFSV